MPAICLSVVGDTSNAQSNNNLRLYLCNNFLGFATTYRSPKNTSNNKASDVIGVATGRMRLPVNTANTTCFSNNTGVGTFWGVACTQNNQYNGTSTPGTNNSWVLLGTDGLPVYEQVATANLCAWAAGAAKKCQRFACLGGLRFDTGRCRSAGTSHDVIRSRPCAGLFLGQGLVHGSA